jgi:hypothetical protein
MDSSSNKIIICTPTYNRAYRYNFINRAANVFNKLENILWIVVEDNNKIDENVQKILIESNVNFIYYPVGPTRKYGMAQWNSALEYINFNNIYGIVYCTGDDNYWDLDLFKEIRKTKNISIFPVGNIGPEGIERPLINNEGKFIKWLSNGLNRRFPVDFNGFAFNSEILKKIKKPYWFHQGRSGESTFLEKFIKNENEFEFLCNNCKDCYVWHNEPIININLSMRGKLNNKEDLIKKNLLNKTINLPVLGDIFIIDGLYWNKMYSFMCIKNNENLFLKITHSNKLEFRRFENNNHFLRDCTFNIYLSDYIKNSINILPFKYQDNMIVYKNNNLIINEISGSNDFIKKSSFPIIL